MSGRDVERRRKGMRRTYEEALVNTMRTADGRTAIWGILDKTGMFAELMTGNSHTFHNIGKRDVGVSIYGDLTMLCRAELRVMEDEAAARANRVAFEQAAEQRSDPTNLIFNEETESNG